MRVGIIGAGIAGLSAGYRLGKHGFHPVIFEKESFSGGRLSSDQVNGFIIDGVPIRFLNPITIF